MTFEIVKAEEMDYQLFASVIQEVYEALEQKEWFAADNAEYTYHMLKDCNGVGYKAIHEPSGAVAGIFLVTFPGNSEENLGRDIGLSEETLPLVAHMDSVAILPQYRGAGLHPENRYSRQNVISQGYEPVKSALKYGGYLREIFLLDRRKDLSCK